MDVWHTRKDKIRNGDTWDKVGVVSVVDKMRKVRRDDLGMCSVEDPLRRCERLAW